METINGHALRQVGAEEDKKEPAFVLKVKVKLSLKPDLANYLGNFILDNHCENKALLALGHELINKT